jgi:hypothetical protein
MSEKLPTDLVSLTELMRSPLILRIATIQDITRITLKGILPILYSIR